MNEEMNDRDEYQNGDNSTQESVHFGRRPEDWICPEYNRTIDRIKVNEQKVKTIEIELRLLKEKHFEMALAQIEDRQLTKSLYDALNEIKIAINVLATSLNILKEKPDVFKETVYKFGIEMAKLAALGGMFYYFIFVRGI